MNEKLTNERQPKIWKRIWTKLGMRTLIKRK